MHVRNMGTCFVSNCSFLIKKKNIEKRYFKFGKLRLKRSAS